MPKWISSVGLLNITLIVVLAAPLLAYIYNGHFSRFMADDYCAAAVGLEYGVIGGVLHWYNTWTGRYTNFALTSLMAPSGTAFAALAPLVIIIMWFVTMLWAVLPIFRLLRLHRPLIAALMISLLVVYATIDGSPSQIQSIYWLGAIIPYVSPFIFVALYVGIFIRAITNTSNNGIPVGSITAGFFITLIGGGLSETYAVLQIAALGIALILTMLFLPKDRRRVALSLLIPALLGAVIAVMIIMAAPGTAVRQSRFADRLPLPELIAQMIGYSLAFIASALAYFGPFPLLTTLSISALLAFRGRPNELPFRLYPARVRRLLGLLAVITGILVTSTIAPGVYVVSGPPPARSYILPMFLMTLMAACWGFLIGFTLRPNRQSRGNILVATIFVLILALGPLASILRSGTLAPKLNVYAKEWDEQEQQIRLQVAEGSAEVVVKPLNVDLPQLIGLDTIGPNPASGANPCAADYYGAQTLIAE